VDVDPRAHAKSDLRERRVLGMNAPDGKGGERGELQQEPEREVRGRCRASGVLVDRLSHG
jgi:hypothetical protein